jgi:hypothetical protein
LAPTAKLEFALVAHHRQHLRGRAQQGGIPPRIVKMYYPWLLFLLEKINKEMKEKEGNQKLEQ